MAAAVEAVHELAVALDERASHWFTTAKDRAEGRGRIDLARTVSPGGIATQILNRFGVRAPHLTFDLSEPELHAWAETFHGGWCEADPRLLGIPFPGVSLDVSSCFPLVADLIGWWDLVCAERVVKRKVTASPAPAVPAGRRGSEGPARPGRLAAVRVLPGPGQPRLRGLPRRGRGPDPAGWSAGVRAAFLPGSAGLDLGSRRPGGGREVEAGPRHHRGHGLCAGGTSRPASGPGFLSSPDWSLTGTKVRSVPWSTIAGSSRRRATSSRPPNSGWWSTPSSSGTSARMDDIWVKEGRTWVRGERPGPHICLPIASSVTAGSHLLLAILERLVMDRGGVVAYRDTDSSIIPSSPLGAPSLFPPGRPSTF